MTRESVGSLGIFSNGFEYFIVDGNIFRVSAAQNEFDTQGRRMGARFECCAAQWQYLVIRLSR